MKKHLLVLNGGSSSLKFTVFEVTKKIGKQVLDGSISLHGDKSVLKYKKKTINYQTGYNLKDWWDYLYEILDVYDIRYVGFRIVHGGEEFTDTVKVNNSFLKKIVKYNKLAPLHNPVTLELMKLVRQTWPRVKMSVSFDTSWHSGLKPEVYQYSLPNFLYNKHKIRKYGFHGLNHEMVTKLAAKKLDKKINKFKAVTCHLGSGSSLAWYMDGKVIDTTMGFSPNEGLTMSTRSGDVPTAIVFYLASELKMKNKDIEDLLNKKSGLLGLTNMRDLRDILSAAGYKVSGFKASHKYSPLDRKRAKLAISIFVYNVARFLASYIGMSKKLDAIVFTGGIGQNSAIIRKMILKKIQKPKNCKVLVIEEAEMINIANKTIKCLSK